MQTVDGAQQNMAMFGMTAKQWRDANHGVKGNIRDYASINELICLSNMENLNAVFINDGMPQSLYQSTFFFSLKLKYSREYLLYS